VLDKNKTHWMQWITKSFTFAIRGYSQGWGSNRSHTMQLGKCTNTLLIWCTLHNSFAINEAYDRATHHTLHLLCLYFSLNKLPCAVRWRFSWSSGMECRKTFTGAWR
jgi:hypothetical protein